MAPEIEAYAMDPAVRKELDEIYRRLAAFEAGTVTATFDRCRDGTLHLFPIGPVRPSTTSRAVCSKCGKVFATRPTYLTK